MIQRRFESRWTVPVLGAIITASVAAAVAIGGAVRGLYQSALDRRYDWRRRCLVDAQSAMLVLREALFAYGSALSGPSVSSSGLLSADPAIADVPVPSTIPSRPVVPGDPAAGPQSFVMSVPEPVELRVAVARGRFAVARSRLEDPVLDDAYERWDERARESLISAQELPRSAEEEAFDEVNRLTGAARCNRCAAPYPGVCVRDQDASDSVGVVTSTRSTTARRAAAACTSCAKSVGAPRSVIVVA